MMTKIYTNMALFTPERNSKGFDYEKFKLSNKGSI